MATAGATSPAHHRQINQCKPRRRQVDNLSLWARNFSWVANSSSSPGLCAGGGNLINLHLNISMRRSLWPLSGQGLPLLIKLLPPTVGVGYLLQAALSSSPQSHLKRQVIPGFNRIDAHVVREDPPGAA